MMALSRRCQGVKCPCTGAGARERGRPRARRTPIEGGADPRARWSLLEGERALERGEARLREAHPLVRDGASSREVRTLERGEACSRGSSRGFPWWDVEVLGPHPARLGKVCLVLLQVLSGDFPVVKGDP
jgi:hypothetical protein